jgi:archaellum component FlaC
MLKKDYGKKYYTPKGDARAEHYEAEIQRIDETIEEIQGAVEDLCGTLNDLEENRTERNSPDQVQALVKEVSDLRKCYTNLVRFLQETHPEIQ